MLPKRIKKPKKETRLRSPGHLKWIRGFQCSVKACSVMPIEAAHVRTGTDGGMGMKPSDQWAIPLCWFHHKYQHQWGEQDFERSFKIDMKELAMKLWAKSPHGERKQRRTA